MEEREFYLFIYKVAKRSGMFMINNVEELNLFVTGYCSGISTGFNLSEFESFVNKHYGIPKETLAWYRIIRLRSGSDIHSLELFRAWFEAFCKEKDMIIT